MTETFFMDFLSILVNFLALKKAVKPLSSRGEGESYKDLSGSTTKKLLLCVFPKYFLPRTYDASIFLLFQGRVAEQKYL